ncbi:phage tail tape measure protein, partial [bacterium]|nr:phage tail tape measure protein [bacterium]
IDRLRLKQSALKRIVDADVAGSFTRMGSTIKSTALMFTGLATAAIGGIFAIANSTSKLGDEIGETAQKLGIGTQELQELRYAALKAGGQEVEQFDKSMELMIKNVTEAANGTGKAVSALEELGLQAGALASMTPDEMLNHIADAMGKVENHSEKLRLALRIFGKGGAPMLLMLDQGSKGLAEFRRQARATGYVLSDQAIRAASDFDDQLRDLKLSALGVRNTLGAALMPVVSRVMGRMTTYLQSNRGEVVRFANQFAAAVERAAPTLFKLADGVLQFAKFSSIVIGKVAHMVGGFENLGFIIGAAFSAKSIFSVISFGGALLKAADGLQMFFTGKSAIVGLSKGFQFLG